MGYLKDDRFKLAVNNIEDGILEAMTLLSSNGSFINTWAFDNEGNISLFQDMNCGCKRFLNKINIGLTSEEIKNKITEDDEFIEQTEDLLLEVNYKHNLENFLFNIKDIFSIKQVCNICEN